VSPLCPCASAAHLPTVSFDGCAVSAQSRCARAVCVGHSTSSRGSLSLGANVALSQDGEAAIGDGGGPRPHQRRPSAHPPQSRCHHYPPTHTHARARARLSSRHTQPGGTRVRPRCAVGRVGGARLAPGSCCQGGAQSRKTSSREGRCVCVAAGVPASALQKALQFRTELDTFCESTAIVAKPH
jgi:hypothetical protein